MTDAMLAAVERSRRETLRWMILRTLHISQPNGMFLEALQPVLQASYPDVTLSEIKKAIYYLAERHLIEYKEQPDGRWFAKILRFGIDIVEYAVDCEPGIARPRST